MNKYLEECEKELKKSNCCLIHFGSVLVKDDYILGRGHNYALKKECNTYCLKHKIENLDIGKNPAVCYAIHSEWMTLGRAIDKYGIEEVNESTLYIIGRYPDGRLWKSKWFACTICARMLMYCGIKEIIGLQFNKEKRLNMKEAFDSAYKHLLGK